MTPPTHVAVEPLIGQKSATAEFTLELGRILHWPPAELAGETLADRDAWRFAVPRATLAQRAELVASLRTALLRATPEGLARLRAAREQPAGVDAEPAVYGDVSAVPIVKAALALCPVELRTVVVRECAFLAVGRESLAWTASSLFLDAADRRKDRVVVLGPRANVWSVCHESAHAWHAPVYERGEDRWPALTVVGEIGFRAHLKQAGFTDTERIDADAELLADGCALSWVLAPAPGALVS